MNRWPTVDPGEFRHRITIRTATAGSDSVGQPLTTFDDVITLYASIKGLSAQELFQVGQFTSQATHYITIPWVSKSIQPGMQVVFGSRVFLIQYPDNVDEMDLVIKMLCLELNASSQTVLPS